MVYLVICVFYSRWRSNFASVEKGNEAQNTNGGNCRIRSFQLERTLAFGVVFSALKMKKQSIVIKILRSGREPEDDEPANAIDVTGDIFSNTMFLFGLLLLLCHFLSGPFPQE
uniref:Transmembrane protein n=1 Tax=Panagrellus redivivus TaxID=6233 RepID=A0A7E4W5H2_PANRE